MWRLYRRSYADARQGLATKLTERQGPLDRRFGVTVETATNVPSKVQNSDGPQGRCGSSGNTDRSLQPIAMCHADRTGGLLQIVYGPKPRPLYSHSCLARYSCMVTTGFRPQRRIRRGLSLQTLMSTYIRQACICSSGTGCGPCSFEPVRLVRQHVT